MQNELPNKQQNNDMLILVAMVPENMKDVLVDALIAQKQLSGFSLSKIQGYSAANSHFNIQEQVEGYKDLYRFEIMHEAGFSEHLLTIVKSLFHTGNLRYWVTPTLQCSV